MNPDAREAYLAELRGMYRPHRWMGHLLVGFGTATALGLTGRPAGAWAGPLATGAVLAGLGIYAVVITRRSLWAREHPAPPPVGEPPSSLPRSPP